MRCYYLKCVCVKQATDQTTKADFQRRFKIAVCQTGLKESHWCSKDGRASGLLNTLSV